MDEARMYSTDTFLRDPLGRYDVHGTMRMKPRERLAVSETIESINFDLLWSISETDTV